jgi:hypothetical protein
MTGTDARADEPARVSSTHDPSDKYLLPGERGLIVRRPHPAVLAVPATAVVGGLLAAAAISQIPRAVPAQVAAWAIWAFLVLRLMLAALNWSNYRFVLTRKRILLISGISARKTMATPLPDLGNVSLFMPLIGRVVGYGTIILGPDARTGTAVAFVPYAEQTYLVICNLIEDQDHKDKGGGSEPPEQ